MSMLRNLVSLLTRAGSHYGAQDEARPIAERIITLGKRVVVKPAAGGEPAQTC